MTPALMVGSRPAWLEKLRPHLEHVGIDVRWLWETRNDPKRGIPAACALMLIATDCNSHTLSGTALSMARAAGINVIHIPHRWAQASPLLERAGFRAPTLALAEVSPAVNIALAVPGLLAPVPEPVKEETPVPDPSSPAPLFGAAASSPPPPPPSPRVAKMAPHKRAHFDRALRLLAADPWLTGAELMRITGLRDSIVWEIGAAARDTLGIASSHGSGAATIKDRPRYEAWCRTLGVVPCPQDYGPTRPPHTAGDNARRAARNAAAPAVDVAPVAPVAPSAPVPSTDTLPPDLIDAVKILRAVMADHGFASVSVSIDGEVRWERRVVRVGAFTL